jgi:two-component system CheB/CheR fusion protein
LAKAQANKAVAIILSGMGHDGSAGLKSIKEQGGTTFAQDEPSAQHGSIPASAIDSGYVDIVTTPRKIAAELVRLARDRPAKPSRKRSVAENGLKNIFALFRSRTEVDFSQYRKTTVRRRIQRRMVVHRIEDVDDYFTFLKRNPEEVDARLLRRSNILAAKSESDRSVPAFPRVAERRPFAAHQTSPAREAAQQDLILL